MNQSINITRNIVDVASACIAKIHNSRHAKAVFLFSETDHQIMGADTKKYTRMRESHPDNFLGIYDARVTVDWLCEDVWHLFRMQEMEYPCASGADPRVR